MGTAKTMVMARGALLVLLIAALARANDTSCGADQPSKVPDCDHPDLGSCGNSCCIMDFELATSPVDTHARFVRWLKAGGSDGSYKYVTGPDSAGHNPGDDLRQYNISWKFIWQGEHVTTVATWIKLTSTYKLVKATVRFYVSPQSQESMALLVTTDRLIRRSQSCCPMLRRRTPNSRPLSCMDAALQS